jgi:hypothetical protein
MTGMAICAALRKTDSSAGSHSARADSPFVSRITAGPQPQGARIFFDSPLILAVSLRRRRCLPKARHPRLFGRPSCLGQLLLDCFRYQLAERNPSLGSDRLGATKNTVRNLRRSSWFMPPIYGTQVNFLGWGGLRGKNDAIRGQDQSAKR